MEKEELVLALKKEFPDWKEGYEECIEEAIQHIGKAAIDKFGSLGWQEQDTIINVFQAIRNR